MPSVIKRPVPSVNKTQPSGINQATVFLASKYAGNFVPVNETSAAGFSTHFYPTLKNNPRNGHWDEILAELVAFGFAATAFFLQLLHIYRAVWWLPQSYTQHAVKLYLINPNIIGVFGLATVPRLLWTLLKFVISRGFRSSWKAHILKTLKISLITAWLIVYGFVYKNLLQLYSIDVKWILFVTGVFIYPVILHGVLEKRKSTFDVLLQLIPEQSAGSTRADLLLVNNAEDIRLETDNLRKEFNLRLQRVLFHSFLTAYSAAIIPCLFTQSYVVYDVFVCMEHVLFTFVGGFTLNAVQAFPLQYCTMLQRSGKYLGSWTEVARQDLTVSPIPWCSKTVFAKGTLVTHKDSVYEAKDDVTASEPGCEKDLRFYVLFGKPGMFQVLLLLLQILLISLQFVFLLRSSEWHQMMSLTFLQAMSCYALFHLVRDCIVARRLELSGVFHSGSSCN